MGRDSMAQSCKRDGCGFDSQSEKTKYSIFSSLPNNNKAKRGVEFCPSTRNASKIRRKLRLMGL